MSLNVKLFVVVVRDSGEAALASLRDLEARAMADALAEAGIDADVYPISLAISRASSLSRSA